MKRLISALLLASVAACAPAHPEQPYIVGLGTKLHKGFVVQHIGRKRARTIKHASDAGWKEQGPLARCFVAPLVIGLDLAIFVELDRVGAMANDGALAGKLDKFLEPPGRIINIVIRRNDIGIGKSQERRYDFLVRADVLAKSDFQSLIPQIDDGRWQQPVILRGDPKNGPVGGDGLRKQASKRKRQAGKTGRVRGQGNDQSLLQSAWPALPPEKPPQGNRLLGHVAFEVK